MTTEAQARLAIIAERRWRECLTANPVLFRQSAQARTLFFAAVLSPECATLLKERDFARLQAGRPEVYAAVYALGLDATEVHFRKYPGGGARLVARSNMRLPRPCGGADPKRVRRRPGRGRLLFPRKARNHVANGREGVKFL